MKGINSNFYLISAASVVLFSLICYCDAGAFRTEIPTKCHVCDPESCKNFNRKAEPKECTVDDLNRDNLGPSKLNNFSYIPYKQMGQDYPLFSCQKLEAYDLRGVYIVRKCQLRLPGNDSCNEFNRNVNADPEKTYMNASCWVCENLDGCNSSGFVYIWIPLLLSSIISCFLMK